MHYLLRPLVVVSLWTSPCLADVDFNRDIRPILSNNCFACHGPDDHHRKAGLRLDRRDVATKPAESGETPIVPGKSGASELIRRITAADPSERMPPNGSGKILQPEQIAKLKQWIDAGAEYKPHWSFVPPKPPAFLPVIPHPDGRNPIDSFIMLQMQGSGVRPAPAADRFTLIRRLSLDLRGLPPTPAEVEKFVGDKSPNAYEKLVDRFLADPAYGERWARVWLDLARYADSAGLGSDPLRLNIWRYRDWVIDAFNRNLPYDQFTIEQIAGDLLPSATLSQRMATAFHRNTMTNTEGGTDDEEFRVAAVKDRTDTTAQVWMALTVGCAKCHNHKFDPISQKEYYQLFAFFNQSADSDKADEAPVLPAPTPEMVEQDRQILAKIAAVRERLERPTPMLAAEQDRWEKSLAGHGDAGVLLRIADAKSASGATLKSMPDGSILVSGMTPNADTYTLTTDVRLPRLTAIKLEVLPDPAIAGGGPGRTSHGNFVLSNFSASVESTSRSAPIVGRYVRIELPGKNRMLSLAEVIVTGGGNNLAKAGKASQSSTDFAGAASRAIDGNTDGDYFRSNSVTHTRAEPDPWWEVDLGKPAAIDNLEIWNRTDGNVGVRLANFRLSILDNDRKPVWRHAEKSAPAPNKSLALGGPRSISFTQASADYAQANFPAMDSLTGKNRKRNGWAIGGAAQKPHSIVFFTDTPLADKSASRLVIRLDQQFHMAGHTIGRFRLSASSDPGVAELLKLPPDVAGTLRVPSTKRTTEQSTRLAAHFRSIAPSLAPIRDELAKLEKSRPTFPTLPVMQELPASQRRDTHVLEKSNFLMKKEKVTAAVPAAFHPLPKGASADRLGLARWLVAPDNPLTARVAVNRYWAALFGAGLVETEEDFGSQGMPPTHPQLLDWLATEFVRLKWDTKALLKLIVTSASYRQSSVASADVLEKDPFNKLLSRGPRFRLEAEMVRDQALALAGLLSRKRHGPSVFPPQPDGLWQAAFNGERTWSTSKNDDRFRRGLYVFWRRTVPYPSMATFDAPSREYCLVRRIRTNTPLQAFVTLNDPVYVEAAQGLARRLMTEGGKSPADRAAFGLRLCTARPPSSKEVDRLVRLYNSEFAHFANHAAGASDLATQPLGPLPAGLDPREAAAWTVVANVLLNLDAVLTKG